MTILRSSESKIKVFGPGLLSVFLAIPTPGASNVPIGIFIVILLLPEILDYGSKSLRSLLTILMRFLVFGLLSGFSLSFISLQQDSGRLLQVHKFLYGSGLITSLTFGLVGIIYAIERIGLRKVVLLFSLTRFVICILGWFSSSIAHFASIDGIHENLWKYGISSYAILISLVSFKSIYTSRFMLLACLGMSAVFHSRLLIAVTFVLILKSFWKPRVKNSERPFKHRVILMAVSFFVIFTVVPLAFNWVSGSGLLGSNIKRTTLSEEGVTKNVLLAGRPEQLAGLSLLEKYPLGFGIGVTPSASDYSIAISNLPISVGLKQHSTVATYFSVDGRFSFHSTFWDFWGLYGIVGMGLILLLIYRSFCEIIKIGSNSVLFSYASIAALWDLIFSPPLLHQSLLVFGIAISQYRKVRSVNAD